MEHWFVYYKLPADEATRCLAAAQPMQQALAAASGVQGRLLRRADETGPTVTLMEVYAPIADPAAFGRQLAQAVQAAALPAAERRLERFAEV